MFSETQLPSRAIADYRRLLFIEHWCNESSKAVELLSKLFSGQADIEGCRIESVFSRSDFEHRPYPTGSELWTGWQLISTRDRDSAWKEIFVPQGRLAARGLKAYRGPDEAINDWIWGLRSPNPHSSDIRFSDSARLSMLLLAKLFDWRSALVNVKPETFIGWHNRAFQLLWRWKSRGGRPRLPKDIRRLIVEMAGNNPTWGQGRVADELSLKLGILVSPRTVRKYWPDDCDAGSRSTSGQCIL